MNTVLNFVLLAILPATLSAQWPSHADAGAPKTPDGKLDLSAPALRTPEGKPDLSGIWDRGMAPRSSGDRAPDGGPHGGGPPGGPPGRGPAEGGPPGFGAPPPRGPRP